MENKRTLIAGAHSGKKIYAVPAVFASIRQLKQAALKGHHWAKLAVLDLHSLSSGRIGKDNIYVHPHFQITGGAEKFYMMLPGCKATILRAPNDSYVVVRLEIDNGYFEEKSRGNKRTGLYEASKGTGKWELRYSPSGRLVPDPGQGQGKVRWRIVAISDGQYESAQEAAREMAPWVSKAPNGGGGSGMTDYDLHYTHGAGRLGGLLNYRQALNPCSIESIMGSSRMLAQTMYKARDIEGVNWVATHGGSAVLTQAMRFLAERGGQAPASQRLPVRPKNLAR